MTDNKKLITTIVEGLQEKKAKKIVIVDMSELEAPCNYFVIAQGDSNVHVMSIATTTKDFVREHAGEKPFATDGDENCQWIAMDYGTAIVHIFQPEFREFYDIEHLWADAKITEIPDLD